MAYYFRPRRERYSFTTEGMDPRYFRTAGGWSSCCSCCLPPCGQATLIFSTMFDQLARIVMEQFLLWSVRHGQKLTTERLVLQVILFFRLIAGGVLVGFTRPDFAPACVARTSVLSVAILVLVLDVIIIGVLIIRALSLGMFRDLREKDSSPRQEQSRALIICIAGFTLWTGVCQPL